jgi:spore maturation protein CgeB
MDSVDLAEQMIRFLGLTPADRRAMGEAGRRKVLTRFDVRDVVRMYQERVNALMSGD